MGLFRCALDQILGRRPAGPNHLAMINMKMDSQMINTSKILAGVAEINTKTSSLIALSNQQSTIMKDLATKLQQALDDDDPEAMAAVQRDLDTAADALHTSAEAVQAALNANTPPAEPPIADQQPPEQPAPVGETEQPPQQQ